MVFELTAREVAEMDKELILRYLKKYPLGTQMFDAMIKEEGIEGGWYYYCLPSSKPFGPFKTREEALNDQYIQRVLHLANDWVVKI